MNDCLTECQSDDPWAMWRLQDGVDDKGDDLTPTSGGGATCEACGSQSMHLDFKEDAAMCKDCAKVQDCLHPFEWHGQGSNLSRANASAVKSDMLAEFKHQHKRYDRKFYVRDHVKHAMGIDATRSGVLVELKRMGVEPDPIAVRQALRSMRLGPKEYRKAPAYAVALGWTPLETSQIRNVEASLEEALQLVETEFHKLKDYHKRRYMVHYPTVLRALAHRMGYHRLERAWPRLQNKQRRRAVEHLLELIFSHLGWHAADCERDLQ